MCWNLLMRKDICTYSSIISSLYDSWSIRIGLITQFHARNFCKLEILTRLTGSKFSRPFSFMRADNVILGWVCWLSADHGSEASPSLASDRMAVPTNIFVQILFNFYFVLFYFFSDLVVQHYYQIPITLVFHALISKY